MNTFLVLLTILFIGLKLTGYIAWSWFWVISPLIASTFIIISILAVMVLLAWVETRDVK